MDKVGKYIWFGINIVLTLGFLGVYLYFTYPCFKTLDEKLNIRFIALLFIMLEGLIESFIACVFADEDSHLCWIYSGMLTLAIFAMAIQFWALMSKVWNMMSDTAFLESPANTVVMMFGLLVYYAQLSISPMLITKFSSWLILGISIIDNYDSKIEFIFPVALILINIVMAIVFACVEMTSGLVTAYICVFGVLSIVSFIVTLKKNDIF